jgi:hypothetical protein
MLAEMTHFIAACRALPKRTYFRSFKVAVVVGTILNLINQPDALLGAGSVVLWQALLTYAVPFCVATYGAICARLELADGQ